jgi:hypothetical protein
LNYENLHDILKKRKIQKSNLKSPRRNTFDKSKINGVVGNFILDTGASNSFESAALFQLQASKQKASEQELQECKHKWPLINYNLILETFRI